MTAQREARSASQLKLTATPFDAGKTANLRCENRALLTPPHTRSYPSTEEA
jgi:hypothetical protein